MTLNLLKEKIFSKRETIRNFAWKIVQTIMTQAVVFFTFIMAAKMLDVPDFGKYNYILSVVLLLIAFSDFGISIAASKFVAEYKNTAHEHLNHVLFNAGLVILFFSSVVLLFLIFFGRLVFLENAKYMYYLIPALYIAPLVSLYDGVYRGLKRFRQLSFAYSIAAVISIISLFFIIKIYGLPGALFGQNIFYCIVLSILVINHGKFLIVANKALVGTILKYSILIGLSNIGYYLYTRADIVILSYLGYMDKIGYYEIVNKLFLLLVTPVMLLATVIAPNNTKKYSGLEITFLKKRIIKQALLLFFLGILVSVITIFAAPVVFAKVFPNYNTTLLLATLYVLILIVPFRYFSSFISIGYITPLGFVKILTVTLIFFGIINVFLDFLLIKIFGYIGVMYATTISQILYISVTTFIFIRKLNKDSLQTLN